MPILPFLISFICVCIPLVTMADTTDSDSYAHAHTIVEPGQDLELGDMNTYFPYVPENVSLY